MTGELPLAGNASAALSAVPLQQVQALINAIPADKFAVGWSAYNATTNTLSLLMADGSTLPVDLTPAFADAVANCIRTDVATPQTMTGSLTAPDFIYGPNGKNCKFHPTFAAAFADHSGMQLVGPFPADAPVLLVQPTYWQTITNTISSNPSNDGMQMAFPLYGGGFSQPECFAWRSSANGILSPWVLVGSQQLITPTATARAFKRGDGIIEQHWQVAAAFANSTQSVPLLYPVASILAVHVNPVQSSASAPYANKTATAYWTAASTASFDLNTDYYGTAPSPTAGMVSITVIGV
jgi:hypothetical protein